MLSAAVVFSKIHFMHSFVRRLSFGVLPQLAAACLFMCPPSASAAWRPTERWRGFNIINRIYNDGPEYVFHEEDIRLVREWGFNFVRVPLNYRHWIKDGDWNVIDETKFGEIDKIVGWGRKYGVHVQLCFHRAPGWCVASWPVEPKNIFKDEEPLAVCEKHWKYFAERYRDVPPEALSFNLMNEPGDVTDERYAAIAKRLIDAIRAVSPDRFIVSDGVGISRRPVEALFGIPGVGQATRGYQPTDITLYNCPWGSRVSRPPDWPYDPEAPIGNFLGPGKRQTYGDHPLVLTDLPTGLLGCMFGIVNGKVTFEVVADGERIAEWELEPKKDDPEWEEYQVSERWKTASARFKGKRGVRLAKPAKRVEIRLAKGDWACLWDVAFRADGAVPGVQVGVAKLPIYIEFGSHVNFEQRYDAAKRRFVAVPDPADATYRRRYSDNGMEYLYRHVFRYWDEPSAKGEFGMIGEFACWKKTPHPVALGVIEDYLKHAKARNMGWAMWEFRGSHGIVNSGREDVAYEDVPGYPGYKVDRKMLELLQRY